MERAKIATSVAARVGVDGRTLHSWDLGQMRPYPRHARRLAKELGVTLVTWAWTGQEWRMRPAEFICGPAKHSRVCYD